MNWLRLNWRRLPVVAAVGCGNACLFLWRQAWKAHVPLAWHIVVVLSAAAGTFYLTPKLTEQFERQKIRSGYVSSNLQELNRLTGDFYVAVMKATSASPDKRVDAFTTVDEVAARLTWKSIEIGAVLTSPEDQRLMRRFATELADTQQAAVMADTPGGRERFKQKLTRFSRTSVLVIQGVAERAELSDELVAGGG